MRILYIEDEHRVAHLVKKSLEEEQYSVDIAPDGELGYSAARTSAYHLVIVDHLLPMLTGREICKRLRAEGHSFPILMLTALGSLGDTVAGLEAGADDYLAKPFALEELIARVRALLRRTESKPIILQVDDLTVNIVTHDVYRSGRQIHLSVREYRLLEFLMRNATSVVTRASIVENVWDMDFDPESNVVDVYINYLRGKINGHGAKPLISTVRGIGYRLT